MNENLRAKIERKLERLQDEQARQVLDYLDFLESKYNKSRRAPSALQRLAENIEDAIGAGTLGDAATKGTAPLVDAAGRVMAGLAAAGRAVVSELSGTPTPPSTPPDPATENGGSGSETDDDKRDDDSTA